MVSMARVQIKKELRRLAARKRVRNTTRGVEAGIDSIELVLNFSQLR